MLSKEKDLINGFWQKKQLAVNMFDGGVFKKNKVSPGLPPFYFDLQIIPRGPVDFGLLSKIGEIVYSDINQYEVCYNCIVGVSTANHFAWALHDRIDYVSNGKTRIKLLNLEKNNLKGKYKKGDSALLVVDILRDAEDCLKTAHLLEEKGLKISAVLAVINEQGEGTKKIKEAGYAIFSILTAYYFLMACMEAGRIKYKTYNDIREHYRRMV